MSADTRTNRPNGALPTSFAAPGVSFAQAPSTFGLSWPGLEQSPQTPIALPPVYAQFGLMQMELAETYLNGTRRIIDLWSTAIRGQQDQFLADWRTLLTLPPSMQREASASTAGTPRKADGAERPQQRQPAPTRRRSQVDHSETTVLANEH